MEIVQGSIIGLITGDTRTLDDSSYDFSHPCSIRTATLFQAYLKFCVILCLVTLSPKRCINYYWKN